MVDLHVNSLYLLQIAQVSGSVLNSLGPIQCSGTTGLRNLVGRQLVDVSTVEVVDGVGVDLITIDQHGQDHHHLGQCHLAFALFAT